jgi:PAS domain S-box-containing protein
MRNQIYEELKRNYDIQRVLNSILELSLEDIYLEELLDKTLDLLLSIPWLSFEKKGAIFLTDEEKKELIMVVSKNLPESLKISCRRIPFGKCLCGKSAQRQEIVFSSHLDEDHEIRYEGIEEHGHYCIPIIYQGKVLGVINLYLKEGHSSSKIEEDFLKGVANNLAGIINHKNLEDKFHRFYNIVEQVKEGVIVTDKEGKIEYVNPSFEEITGYTLNEVKGKRTSILSPEEVKRPFYEKHILNIHSGKSFIDRMVVKRKDGEIVHVLISITPIKDKDGNINYYVGTIIDISEQVLLENELREREERLKRASEIGKLGYWDWDIIKDKITWSEEVYKIFGKKEDDFGSNYKSFLKLVHDEDKEFVDRSVKSALYEKKPYSIDHRIVLPDGSLKIVHEEAEVIFDEEGNPIRMFGTVQDITEIKKLEEELRKHSEELEELVKERTKDLEDYIRKLYKLYEISYSFKENSYEFAKFVLKELVHMLDVDFATLGEVKEDKWIAYATSAKEALLIKEKTILPLKETFCDIVFKTQKPLVINDTFNHEEYKNHPAYLDRKIRSYLGVPVFIGDKFFGVLASFSRSPHNYSEYDVIIHQLLAKRIEFEFIREKYENELKIALKSAEIANKAKSDFIASMSHELRTPLNAIIGFSEILLEEYFGPLNEKQKEYIKDILESSKYLLSLINDILDLSKIEAGKMELEISDVNIKDLLEDSLMIIRERARVHSIQVEVVLCPELENLVIKADERKLKQVMYNLLSNAVKFTPDGGRIKVEVGIEKEYLKVSVEDNGIGIPKEYLEKIFEPFFQIKNAYKNKPSGTGLGLSIAKTIVELHGGKIWAESEGEGKGSKFTFIIPIKRNGQ